VDAKGCISLAAAAITIAEPVVVSATISVTHHYLVVRVMQRNQQR
jgi:hypothetical protein